MIKRARSSRSLLRDCIYSHVITIVRGSGWEQVSVEEKQVPLSDDGNRMAYRRVQSFEAGSVAQGQEGEAFRTDPLRAAGRNAPRAPGRAEWGAHSKHTAISVFLT